MTAVAPRTVNSVSCVKRIDHERVAAVAPRIVNDVSYVTRIYHENHFSWQAQYLVLFGEVGQ